MSKNFDKCERCGEPLSGGHIMSVFNTDHICMVCKEEERMHPDYARARDAENEAVKNGNLNFPGIGYTPPPIPETQTGIQVIIDTSGPDSNAFAIMAITKKLLEKAGRRDLVAGYLEKAKSGSYEHLKAVTRQYIKVHFK